MEQIFRNIRTLEKKLQALDLQASFDLAVKIKHGIIGLGEELKYVTGSLATDDGLFCKCDGYMSDGVVCLEIGEELPHSKVELSSAGHEYWLRLIHTAIYRLSEKASIQKYDKAFVGIYTAMPKGYNNTRVWDASNRALNLILNNLKGIFFPDDDIEHMAFAVIGGWSDTPKTTIYIGNFESQVEKIMEKLILVSGTKTG